MRIKPLPKSWLIHTIVYEEYTRNKDDWGNLVYKRPVNIRFVRFDESTVFSRDNTQTKIIAEAVVFIDAANSSPVPEFTEQSVITFGGKRYILKKVVPCYYPNQNKVHHWELEVI
ncbi:minor capsid protein [Sporosarcina sp. P13]|uniref:putative minor capsid protein n=1 Tax=Sporosarcina sp. P13 TaxID=2048263 RepID=UPI000C170E6F|nr:putative minor capsid protein [Sporosarcina sp. P13]PIC65338.1 minor capsid protein [Sporosarcina sp. P13]